MSLRRPRWRGLAFGATCLLAACSVPGCGKTQAPRGGLMLVVSSDGPLPLYRVEIEVRSEGRVLLHNDYRVPQDTELPATVAIVSNGSATAQAEISVVGWGKDVPLDRRDAIVTQIPTARVASLSVVLSARCSDKVTVDADGAAQSTCGKGDTCDGSGRCVDSTVRASDLPEYGADPSGQGVAGSSSGGTSSGGSGGSSSNIAGSGAGGEVPSTPDACADMPCDTPPPNDCVSPTQFRAYDKVGNCAEGICDYKEQLIDCTCEDHACTTDPCAGVTCVLPPSRRCNGRTLITYAATGTCSEGSCSYTAYENECPEACKPLGVSSKCVQCLTDEDCGGVRCDPARNICTTPPSCSGLVATCGPNGDASCCASSVVPGGTFSRFNLGVGSLATVSDFRMDIYEVTVGRFRNFLGVYNPSMIAQGAGKNPNNPDDTGWDTAWSSSMRASSEEVVAALACYQDNWSPVPVDAEGESRPVTCVSWLEAQAFCIWDGGRLPTEAEWSYAATGGAEQRKYPWGSAAVTCDLARHQNAACGLAEADGPIRVGAKSPQGDGKFRHADLAGNAWEYVQDWFVEPPPVPCTNCAQLVAPTGATTGPTVLGGSFYGNPMFLANGARRTFGGDRTGRSIAFGIRCVRPL